MANLPNEGEETLPCEVCGRHFVKSSLQKHEPICRKMTRAKRKVFDSGVQRATGSDITIDNVKNARKEREKLGGTFPRPKTSWREKHETFVSAVSASRQVNYALRTGTPLPPPPKTSTPKDYIQCEYCGRSFNEAAAQRHIPFCKTQHEKKGPMKITSSAKPLAMSNAVRKAGQQHSYGGIDNVRSTPVEGRRRGSSLSREGRPASKKDAGPAVAAERRPTGSSRRAASPQQYVNNVRGNERRNSASRRSSSAPRSSSKSRGQTGNAAGREQISSSASHRANSREKTPLPVTRQSSGSKRGNRPATKKGT